MNKNNLTYEKSGVNIKAADKFVKFISLLSKKTKQNSNFNNIGSFGSITKISNKCAINFIGLKSTSKPCPPRDVSPVKILITRGNTPKKKPVPPSHTKLLVSLGNFSNI